MDHKKIVDSLRHCSVKGNSCRECPSYHQDSGCLDRLHAEAAALLEAQQKRIAELEAKGKWIPVEERLPETIRKCLVVKKDKHGNVIGTNWYFVPVPPDGFGGWNSCNEITLWMPLPEGPKEVADG